MAQRGSFWGSITGIIVAVAAVVGTGTGIAFWLIDRQGHLDVVINGLPSELDPLVVVTGQGTTPTRYSVKQSSELIPLRVGTYQVTAHQVERNPSPFAMPLCNYYAPVRQSWTVDIRHGGKVPVTVEYNYVECTDSDMMDGRNIGH